MTPPEQADQAQDEAPTEIIAEDALEQRVVPFMGDDLAAARTEAGGIYLSLPGICRALGLTAQAQLRRITRTPNLRRALRRIPLETRGGPQIVNCLRLDKVALWLAGVETLSVKEQYRAKIEAYQEELAPLAMQVFMRSVGIAPAPQPSAPPAPTAPPNSQLAERVAEIAEQMDALTSVLMFMREHMNAQLAQLASNHEQINSLSGRLDDAVTLLEMLTTRQQSEPKNALGTQPAPNLTTAHIRAIQEQIDRMVQETRRLPSPLSHFMIYGRLKRRFHASSYREIPDDRYEEILDFLLDELRRALNGEEPEQDNPF